MNFKKEKTMKLNLGCHTAKLDGFINIDCDADVNPDLVLHLGKDKLPFKDNSVDYVSAYHFFEHIIPDETKQLIDELYRVCKDKTVIEIVCPHFKSPTACNIDHKQFISERYFYPWDVSCGRLGSYFKVSDRVSLMRYKPNGLPWFVPFIGIIPCNVYFKLVVVKGKNG